MKKNQPKPSPRRSLRSKRISIAVVPQSDGWVVRRAGSKRASRAYGTKREAEMAARQILEPRGGGEIVVHSRDGRIRGVDSYTLGAEAFAKISAVEGIALTEEMRRDFRILDRRGLSAPERRRWLIEKYGK